MNLCIEQIQFHSPFIFKHIINLFDEMENIHNE